ncbi:uncharacterized protein LOC6553881 [Drosophila erecta]|uniref:GG16294 n=1 Tax=Drosophila erecta TaxID=7220 RepID=B3P398_DROER|nr:uncharacterized protein LOC6553881 [Drosophila erecta]EDV48550.1 uncharacterized protein Dere_GG16294 [Drosophila erecta]
MKFAIVLLAASIACISAQGPAAPAGNPLAGNPFAAANPYAAAFNPFLNGIFGGAGTGAAAGVAAPVAPSAPFGGASVSSFFQSIVLQREAERLLSQPDFPTDLAERVQDVVATSQESISGCDNTTLPWLQIRCVKPLLTTAKNQLKAIDDEWQARLAAIASPAGAAPA